MSDVASNHELYKTNIQTKHNHVVFTGGDNPQSQLLTELQHLIKGANKIDIIVSFLRCSGVDCIINEIKDALQNNAQIRLLTGTYLNITQPSALYKLWHEFHTYIGKNLDIHVFTQSNKSFHAKAYMFHYHNKKSCMFIGSSNLSKSALTSGIEWNYLIANGKDENAIKQFSNNFEELFCHNSEVLTYDFITRYSENWRAPVSIAKFLNEDENDNISPLIKPRGAQIEALTALERSREAGSSKALIVAATGIGKTYLAAFDSKNYKRVLFIAHREEILKQAASSFVKVRGCSADDVGFFYSNQKDTKKPIIFAGVQTLGRNDKLNPQYFAPDYFDYIVIDECHHACASSYQKIIAYFAPKFLLGLTATPDRMDGKSIYALTDYNVPYAIDLFTAINHDLLVPFHYYTIYDYTVNYDLIKTNTNGEYVEKDLEHHLSVKKRHELVFKSCDKYPGSRTLGFCVSRRHAIESAIYFTKHGLIACAVVSSSNEINLPIKELATTVKQANTYDPKSIILNRTEAIKRLQDPNDPLCVIFSVDMFNEGVDIPEIDKVLLLRPTLSPTVFFQQLGRGLRKAPTCPQKKYLTVIDFIGNYKHAGLCFSLLGRLNRDAPTSPQNRHGIIHPLKDYEYPEGCFVDVDLKLIDLFNEINLQRQNALPPTILIDEYIRIKQELNVDHLSRYEYVVNLEDKVFNKFIGKKKEWPLANWLEFRGYKIGDLSSEEEKIRLLPIHELITQLENERFTRSYKIPVLVSCLVYDNALKKAPYKPIDIRTKIPLIDILESFKKFYANSFYQQDLGQKQIIEKCLNYSHITINDFKKLVVSQPLKYIGTKTAGKDSCFRYDDEQECLILNERIKSYPKDEFSTEDFNSILKVAAAEVDDILKTATYIYFKKKYQDAQNDA